jgi:hypothetical protein
MVFLTSFVCNFLMNFTPRTVPLRSPGTCAAPPLPSQAPNRAETFLTCGSKTVQESLLHSPDGGSDATLTALMIRISPPTNQPPEAMVGFTAVGPCRGGRLDKRGWCGWCGLGACIARGDLIHAGPAINQVQNKTSPFGFSRS